MIVLMNDAEIERIENDAEPNTLKGIEQTIIVNSDDVIMDILDPIIDVKVNKEDVLMIKEAAIKE